MAPSISYPTTATETSWSPWSTLGYQGSRPDTDRLEMDAVLRPRREIQATKYQDRRTGQTRWIVFDPFSRRSFRIGDREYRLSQLCNGVASLGEIISSCWSEHPDASDTNVQRFQQFAASMIRDFQRLAAIGIVAPVARHRVPAIRGYADRSDADGTRLRPTPARPVSKLLSSAVVWRLPGLNLDRQLTRLARQSDWLYSTLAVRIWLGLCALSVLMIGLNFQDLPPVSQLWSWIATPSKTGLLFVIFVLTRAAHELGHAIVCKRFGIRCPDIGFLIIVGTPCMYCDVSESWRLPERWKRASIAAAGMYTECIIASVAALIWLYTTGPLSELALQTAVVCSISTILINANPLMRFDGYHILADWLDEPNLRAKSDQLSYRTACRWILGTPKNANQDTMHPQETRNKLPHLHSRRYRTFLSAFSTASWIYRGVLAAAIAAAIVAIYSRWHLSWFGRGLAVSVLVSMWGGSLFSLFRALLRDSMTRLQRGRVFLFIALLCAIALFCPIPQRSTSVGWIQPSQSQAVFAQTTARLEECFVADGEPVQVGTRLFEMAAADSELRSIRLSSAAELAKLKAEQLRRDRNMHGQDLDLSEAHDRIRSAEQLAQNALRANERLSLKADASGIFVAAKRTSEAKGTGSVLSVTSTHRGPNAVWTEASQIGRQVEQGTLLGTIQGHQMVAVLPLSTDALERVQVGEPVKIRIAGTDQVLSSTITRIVQLNGRTPLNYAQSLRFEADALPHSPSHVDRSFAAIANLENAIPTIADVSAKGVFHLQSLTLYSLVQRWIYGNGSLLAD